MDWAVLTGVAMVGAYAGYLIGLLIRGALVDRGPGGGGEMPPEPSPDLPRGTLDDFDLWEKEVALAGMPA